MKDRFRQRRVAPDFCVLRIRRPHCLFGKTPFIPSLVKISKCALSVSIDVTRMTRQLGKSIATVNALFCPAWPFSAPAPAGKPATQEPAP